MAWGNQFSERLEEQLRQLQLQDRRRARRTVVPIDATTCSVDGRPCVDFSSNDYLSLSRHPDVCAAFQRAAAAQVGARASALVTGRSSRHAALEAALATFEHAAAGLLFPSGFAANTGTLTGLISGRDAVYCDRDNHASLVDGCRASAGRMLVYRRDQLERLDQSLTRRRADYDQLFIVTDSVFSMDGTVAPLDQLCELARQHDAVLVVDEAHATGVFGPTGGGICEQMGLQSQVAVRTGTLSKAIGALGGFVVGSESLVEVLWHTARSQFFSTALPEAVCAAALKALEILQQDHARRARLHTLCDHARAAIRAAGLSTVAGSCGPIIPVLIGADDATVRLSARLQNAGYFVPAIRPPTVPRGTSRLRISINCQHTESQIEELVQQIAQEWEGRGSS